MFFIRSLLRSAMGTALLAGVLACSSSDSGGSTNGTGGSGAGGSSVASAGQQTSSSGGGGASSSASGGGAGVPDSSSGGRPGGSGGSKGGAGGNTETSSGGAGGSMGASTGGKGGVGGKTGGAGGGLGGSGGKSDGSSASSPDAGADPDGSVDSGTIPGEADGGTSSPGCGTTITRPSPNAQQTMTVGGKTRYYLLDVPSGADNKTPLMLIFALHGYNMNNISVQGPFNFTSRSNGKAITVYPQGDGDPPGNVSHWGSGISSMFTPNEENSTFIHELLVDLQRRYCIDTRRVFLAGFSMGGLFTNFTACEHPDWFRAFAPVEGMGPGGNQAGTAPLSCANVDAKPAIMIHQGAADTSVIPEYGEKTRDFWADRNTCSKTTTTSFTGCKSYSDCTQPVVYCPGSWGHSIEPQAVSNIWSFFSSL